MSILIFSTLTVSVIFSIVLGSWYSIQGPFLFHVALLISVAIAIFSAAILVAAQPLFSLKSNRQRRDLPKEVAWGQDVSNALSSPAAILDGYVVKFVNTPFLQTLRMVDMADQVIEMPFTNLIHPADHRNFAELCAETASGKSKNDPTKIRLVCADGALFPCNASLSRMREDSLNSMSLFQFTPISATIPLSNDFESQFNYHSIIDRLEEVVFQLNTNGKIIFLNPSWERLLEYKVKNCLNLPLVNFFHPEDKPTLEAILDSLTQGKRSTCTIEARLLSIQGDPSWVVVRAKTTLASVGERTGVIGTITNIQNQKETEASLLASRRSSNSLLNQIHGMVYRGRNDRFWTFEFVSDGCIDITGYDPQELINNPDINFNLIIHPEDRLAVWDSVNQQLLVKEKFELIYRIVTRKGDIKLVQEHGRGIFSSTGELLALEGFITEISNQKYNLTSVQPNTLQ